MSKICPNCGQTADDNANFCPNCGGSFAAPQPTANVKPPKFGEKVEHKQPPVLPRPKKRKFTLAVAFAAASVAIILLLCIIMFVKKNTTVTVTKHVVTNNAPTMADDSIFDEMEKMAEEQMDEMSNMEKQFVYGGDNPSAESHAATSPVVKLIGKIDTQPFIMRLNIKDPGNIKGTGSFVVNGKKSAPLQLLGILSGDGNLKISAYDETGKAMGNFDGSYNGSTYTGTYSSAKSANFQFAVTE